MKFLITSKYSPAQYDGAAIVFMTGKPPFVNQVDSLFCQMVGQDKVLYKTGFKESDIKNNRYLLDSEKEFFLAKQKKLVEQVEKEFGDAASDASNRIFWDENRTSLRITNDTLDTVFDTDRVDDAILYLNIIGGGYATVAPSEAVADRTSKHSFYLTTIEDEVKRESEDMFGSKMEAIIELGSLLNGGIDGLVYISYLLSDLNKGYTKNTSTDVFKRDMLNYIENGVGGKDKKKSASNFYKLSQQWKNDRETLMGKAVVSAGIHYGLIKKKRDKRYEYKGLDLGTTSNSAYDILNKAANHAEFGELTDEIEKILNK